jgi:hypothetical protein
MVVQMTLRRRLGFAALVALALASLPFACSNAPQYPGGGRDLDPFGNMLMGSVADSGQDVDGAKADTGIDTGIDTGVQ